MRRYIITLPQGVEIDVFNLPENFKEIVEKTFAEFSECTVKEYRYCDKLLYIDCLIQKINGVKNSSCAVDDIVCERLEYEWKENRNLNNENEIYSDEFMELCYESGQRSARLYSHYGLKDKHIYEQVQKVIVKIITIIMNYNEENYNSELEAVTNDKQETIEACNKRVFDYDAANIISEFLQSSVYEYASKAVDREFDL